MSRRYLFIVNANACKSDRKLIALKNQISRYISDFELCLTHSKDDARQEIQSKIDDFDVIVACGGDGTIQLVASQLVDSTKVLGILPIGSGNDFSKLLNAKPDLEHFLSILKHGTKKKIDIVRISNSDYFINTFGIGFDGLANQITRRLFWLPGAIKYLIAAIIALLTVRPFKAKIRINETHEVSTDTHLVVLSNGRWEGGRFQISPISDIGDGKIEMIISIAGNKWGLFTQLIRLSFGRGLNPKKFDQISFTEAKIELDTAIISHSDGDVNKALNKFHFKVIPGALTILS